MNTNSNFAHAVTSFCLKKKLKPVVELTWRDWELYEGPGAEEAEIILNKGLEKALCARDVYGAWTEMHLAMDQCRAHGATDSEPQRLAARYIEAMFSEDF